MKLVIEFQYFPPSILYKTLQTSTHLLQERYERFQKMSYRNRLVIAGSDGPLSLSIPLRGGRDQKAFISEVAIDNRMAWQAAHFRSIESCYNRSPWFEYFRDELNRLYEMEFEFLIDWNLACMNWVLQKIGLDIPVSVTESWKDTYDPKEFNDWRNKLLPRTVHSIPRQPTYRQVFMDRTGFLPHLSILDLLFCEGRNSSEILKQL